MLRRQRREERLRKEAQEREQRQSATRRGEQEEERLAAQLMAGVNFEQALLEDLRAEQNAASGPAPQVTQRLVNVDGSVRSSLRHLLCRSHLMIA